MENTLEDNPEDIPKDNMMDTIGGHRYRAPMEGEYTVED
jgi:hypothetical protein